MLSMLEAVSPRVPIDSGTRGSEHLLPQLVLDQVDCGLVVCDALGRMLHANRAAQRELNAGHVLKVEDGVLCTASPCSPELTGAIQSAALQGRRRMVCAGNGPTLMLVVMPLAVGAAGEESRALVMIGRRTLCTPLGLELLAIRHRLTLAEQRVLRALVCGSAARDIAAANGVAVSTIRTQIQSIRDKLGVGNIDELLLTAARIPLVPSCH